MLRKLAIISTHPIQYFAPVFKLLAARCKLRVFYTWGVEGAGEKIDKDFGKKINWDIPLLDGYEYEFLKNTAKNPGSHHFLGIKNPEIINKISAFNPDAILVYGWAYQSHLKVLRHFSGKIPIWFRGDSTLLDEKPAWKKLLRKVILTWVYSYVDIAFYVGSANKAYYQVFGLKENQLIFAPHAVDNDRFAENRKKEAEELRKELNIKPEEILILFAGKLEWKKNPELLLQAFVELTTSKEERPKTKDQSALQTLLSYSDENGITLDGTLKTNNKNQSTQDFSLLGDVRRTGVHLLFVGNGALESSLKSQISHLTSNRIHFMPFQNQTQMPVIYQACDLLCLPSKGPGETWGLAVNEAMAAGKAILVSDKVGCGIDLVDKTNGAIFKHGDVESLIENLEVLTENKKSLGERGLQSTIKVKDWSFEKQTEAILKELSKLKNE